MIILTTTVIFYAVIFFCWILLKGMGEIKDKTGVKFLPSIA